MSTLLQVIQRGELRGAEVFALDLARALALQGGWSGGVVSLFGIEPAYAAAAEVAGVPLVALRPDGRAGGLDVGLVRQLRTLIDTGGYRVVQANGAATLKYLVAARRLARRPWRLVYRAIGMGSHWRRGLTRRLVYRWLLAQPDRVVAVCRAVADDLLRAARLDPTRLTVVPNGVAPVRIRGGPDDRARTRAALGLAPSDVLLIYIGSLAPEKNLGALVTAVAHCRAGGLAVRALIIGNGPSGEGLRALLARDRSEEVVQLLPARDGIAPYLAAADLCVLPSLSEGMPALLIEAGLAGVPAVAYAVGGVPEVIQTNVTGVLVDAGDLPGLTGAVAALAGDEARRRAMGAAAAARYRVFDIAVVARAYAEMYGALLNERRAA